MEPFFAIETFKENFYICVLLCALTKYVVNYLESLLLFKKKFMDTNTITYYMTGFKDSKEDSKITTTV